MTGKVVDGDPKGLLVLILPIAVGMVLIYEAWRWILLGLTIAVAWIAWDTYQWQQKCEQIDPAFTQLIQRNQGIITKADLVEQGLAKGRAAQRYLNDKVKEYGAYERATEETTVYYFITSSTLGTIFDDSAIPAETPPQLTAAPQPEINITETVSPPVIEASPAVTSNPTELSGVPVGSSPFAQLAEVKEERKHQTQTDELVTTTPAVPESETAPSSALNLIQSELAKRLDTTSSTIARRKNEEAFAEWSQSKDPDGLVWAYDAETKLFSTI